MPVSLYQPDVVVEVAFNAGYATAAASRVWTDVSAYVNAESGIQIQRGRQNEVGAVTASQLSLTLDNRDGRFTPEHAAGAYYPNIKLGRPIRVRTKPVGAGAYTDQFMGYVTEWPVAWPDGSNLVSTVTVTAASRMARLGRGLEFRSIVEEEILNDLPVLYFPLGEAAGALQAGNIAVGRSDRVVVTQIGTGGTLVFGAGIGPGTDDLTAPVLTPVSAGNGVILFGAFASPLTQPTDTVVDLEVFVNTTSTADNPAVVSLSTPGGLARLTIDTIAGGFPRSTFSVSGSTSITIASPTSYIDGATHHISARVLISGGNATVSIMVDGGTRTTGTPTAHPSSVVPQFSALTVGSSAYTGAGSPGIYTGTLAHVAAYSGTTALTDARVAAHSSSGLTGFSGEASGARVARYARLAGIPTAEISVETGLSTTIAHADTTGQTAIEMMQKVAETEDGLVFDGKDGTLTFHARSRRYGSTSAFTLSVTAGEVEANLSPALDDQGTTNDVKATRAGGAEAHAVNQASITEYGYYRDTLDLMTTSDNEVQSRADWQVNRFGTPRVKLTSISVDLINSSTAQQTLLLAADLGTRFTVSNLPSQAPATTMDFFVEGITLDIGPESMTVTFNTSAAAYADVALWDSGIWDQSIWAY